jgi:hypothetical protein
MTTDLPNPPKLMVAGSGNISNMAVERKRSIEYNSQETHFRGRGDKLSINQERSMTDQVPPPGGRKPQLLRLPRIKCKTIGVSPLFDLSDTVTDASTESIRVGRRAERVYLHVVRIGMHL